MAQFVPRQIFPAQVSLPRSYYLGHHAAGLSRMKTMLSSIDLIIECRDYRVPLTSRNPLFEQSLAGQERLVIYTKRDLGSKNRTEDRKREEIMTRWHLPHKTLFTDHKSKRDIKSVLRYCKDFGINSQSVVGSRILVVGMPNVGKSSLLNALRAAGVGRPKAAFTGAQPGITRKIASGVKIVDRDEESGVESVYLVDTPGVFIPFVPDADSMLKLALVGCVKDTIIAPTTLADYLLYQINRQPESATLYQEWSEPTNDIIQLLGRICRKTGRLGKGGVPDLDAAALWMIQRWRQGNLGTFVLDEVTEDAMELKLGEEVAMSLNQARKHRKDAQRGRGKAKHAEAVAA